MRLPQSAVSSDYVLEARDLSVFRGAMEIVHKATIKLRAGTVTALVGLNGAGKTTLVEGLAGLLRTRGTILLDDKPLGSLNTWSRASRGLSIVQEGRKVFHSMTVLDNLLLPAWHRASSKGEIETQLGVVFRLFAVLARKRHDPVVRLSGGEQQMLAIGQGLMGFPRLLVLDEPAAGLAPIVVEQVIESIHYLSRLGQSVLVVEQSLNRARRIAEQSYIMRLGHLTGPVEVDELMSMSLRDFDEPSPNPDDASSKPQ